MSKPKLYKCKWCSLVNVGLNRHAAHERIHQRSETKEEKAGRLNLSSPPPPPAKRRESLDKTIPLW